MAFSNGFVVSVKVNGSCQKELANGTVVIPLGSDYSLYLKNTNSKGCIAKIFIDTQNVSEGGYIIPAKQSIEIERHAFSPMKFKFVSLDSVEAIMAGKSGDNSNKSKGLIEVRFFAEKTKPIVEEHHHHHYDQIPWVTPNPWPAKPYNPYAPFWYGVCERGNTNSLSFDNTGGSLSCVRGMSAGFSEEPPVAFACNEQANLQDGCTVKGGYSSQEFGTSFLDVEDSYTSIKLYLQGYVKKEEPKVVSNSELTEAKKKSEELEELLKELEKQEEIKKKIKELLGNE